MKSDFLQGFLFGLWLVFVIVKDLGIPLMGKLKKKAEEKREPPAPPPECPILTPRVQLLEVDLAQHKTRVTDFTQTFRELLREQSAERDRMGEALDNKLEIVLKELQEFREGIDGRLAAIGERLKGVETHVDNLKERISELKPSRRGHGD